MRVRLLGLIATSVLAVVSAGNCLGHPTSTTAQGTAKTGGDAAVAKLQPAPDKGIAKLFIEKIGTVKGASLVIGSGHANGAHFSPDGRYLFTGKVAPARVQLWSVPDLKLVKEFSGSKDTQQPFPLYHPNGRLLASTIHYTSKVETKLWSLPDWKLRATLKDVAWGKAVSNDGRLLAAVKGNGGATEVGLWSLPDGKFVKTLLPKTAHATSWGVFAFSPTMPLLATEMLMTEEEYTPELKRVLDEYRKAGAGREKSQLSKVVLWSVPDGKLLASLPGAQTWGRFSADGRELACIGPKGGIHLYSVPDGKLLAAFGDDRSSIPASRVYGGAFSPDGRHIVYGDAQSTRMWSVADGKLVATFPASLYGHAAFSPDGRILALANAADGNAAGRECRLWSVPDGKLLATVRDYEKNDKDAFTYYFAFSPDGRTLATLSADGTPGGARTSLWLYAEGESLDWSLGKAIAGQKPRADVALSRTITVYAGDRLSLGLTMRNTGDGDLRQLWAEARGESPYLSRLGCLFGRVQAGESVERSMGVLLPADHPTGTIKGSMFFREGNDNAPEAQPFIVEVKPLPRPDFSMTTKPGDLTSQHSTLRLKRGQTLELPVAVRNGTGDAIAGLRLTLQVLEGHERVTLKGATSKLGTVPNDGKAEGQVAIQANSDAPAGAATFALRAEDAQGRVFAVQQFTIPVAEKSSQDGK